MSSKWMISRRAGDLAECLLPAEGQLFKSIGEARRAKTRQKRGISYYGRLLNVKRWFVAWTSQIDAPSLATIIAGGL